MALRKLSIILPAVLLFSLAAQADQGGSRRKAPPSPGYQEQPQQDYNNYPPQGGGYPPPQQGYFPPQQGCCGGPAVPYFCAPPMCGVPPVLPFPPPVWRPVPMPPPVLPPVMPPYRPIPPPVWGGAPGGMPGYGPRPMPPIYLPQGPMPRQMSGNGCEAQQHNNGVWVVLSSEGHVIYSDSTEHAAENAEAVRVHYEKSNTGLCGKIGVSVDPNKVYDI